MTQAVGKRMIAGGGGRIISIVANMWRGFPGWHIQGRLEPASQPDQVSGTGMGRRKYLGQYECTGGDSLTGLDTYPPEVQAALEAEVPKQEHSTA